MLYGMLLVVCFVVFACVSRCVWFVSDVFCDVCMVCGGTGLCLCVWWLKVFVCCLQLLVWCCLVCVLCVIWCLCVWLCLCFVRDSLCDAVWCVVLLCVRGCCVYTFCL